ncbi:MAG: flagellar biosynthetic protein FliO [Candidatus Marinimicrobia bacterium]|nr:flagellar biosynthetic protein FliO [Candidatus Neomarinimicrobiota bacterium]
MFKKSQNKSDRIKSYIVALIFIFIAVIGIWLTFSGSSHNKPEKTEQQAKITTTDSTSKPSQPDQFNGDSTSFTGYNRKSNNSSGKIIKTIVIAVLFLVFLTIGLIIFKRKFNTSKISGMDMEVLGKRHFGQKQFIIMTRVENKKLLLGVTDHSINLIKDFGEIEEGNEDYHSPDSEGKSESSFPKIIKQISINKD